MDNEIFPQEREAENTRLELERKQREKTDEAEQLRSQLSDVELKLASSDPEIIKKAHENLERVYESLQHQFQVM